MVAVLRSMNRPTKFIMNRISLVVTDSTRMDIQMKKIASIACLFAAAALLAGCPKKQTTVEPPTPGAQVPGSGSSNANGEGASTSTNPLGGDANAMGGAQGGGPGGAAGKVIYFDFDKSDIKPEFASTVS